MGAYDADDCDYEDPYAEAPTIEDACPSCGADVTVECAEDCACDDCLGADDEWLGIEDLE